MNLSNGVEPADQSQPTATNSLIARNRSHTRKRAQGHHICRGLDCRARRCQHLTLITFLLPLTAPAVRYSEVIQFDEKSSFRPCGEIWWSSSTARVGVLRQPDAGGLHERPGEAS